jgi:F-type H+-transporting ATPase subunit a
MAAGHTDTFHHVRDFPYFELPQETHIGLPNILGLQLTKFMVLQVVAGLLVLLIFRGLARRVQSGEPAKGRWWNFWETLALYIRDNVVRPTIGTGHHHDEHHDDHGGDGHHGAGHGHGHAAAVPEFAHPADKYLPFVWTCFFYVLFCNLLGAFPFLGSATAEINVTGALALATMAFVVISGSRELGAGKFWLSLAPSMDLPPALKVALVPMIWVIEFIGFAIKHVVLAVRLFANIMAGHTVIAVILGFIAIAADSWLFNIVMPASIFGQIAIGMLELFVAFLQAYLFAFLASLFISTAVHPH